MLMAVMFQMCAVSGRPIATYWAIWPIRAECDLGKEGFRETKLD